MSGHYNTTGYGATFSGHDIQVIQWRIFNTSVTYDCDKP